MTIGVNIEFIKKTASYQSNIGTLNFIIKIDIKNAVSY